jgi:hypothetical protein
VMAVAKIKSEKCIVSSRLFTSGSINQLGCDFEKVLC